MPESQLLKLQLIAREPRRVDRLLLEELKKQYPTLALSRALLKDYFHEGKVLLSGRMTSASTELPAGTYEITLEQPELLLNRPTALSAPSECFLPVVYEDAEILVLHKFSGIPSVSLKTHETRTAAAAALAHSPELALVAGAKPLEPGLLHRLDTGTSGLLVFAKTAEEFARLRGIWKKAAVVKTYRALVETHPRAAQPRPCTITDALARSSSSKKKMLVLSASSVKKVRFSDVRGEPLAAVTHIRAARPLGEDRYDLEIDIETGVMHQIRAHLSEHGWPILGDRIYGGAPAARLMLHAWKLALPLKTGARLVLESALPANFIELNRKPGRE